MKRLSLWVGMVALGGLLVLGGCKDDDGGVLTGTPICADVDGDGISGFAEPASSVQTYMIGYGDAVNQTDDINRLNWMAWGGSGLYTNFPGTAGSSNAAINTTLANRKTIDYNRDAIVVQPKTLRMILDCSLNCGVDPATPAQEATRVV